MKIIDIQRFINEFKLLTEGAVTLPNIRQGILGKKGMKEYPIVDDEKEWYENHKEEFLSTIEKVLNVDDKTLKNNLQKFDTEPYFTNEKPRKLKPKELLKAVEKKFISQVERSRNTEEKTTGIEDQYEMTKMGNGVEVYAVYTPMANRYLSHKKLKSENSIMPQWCIASSSAEVHWSEYFLYLADYPSVFIVTQKRKDGNYAPIKYEIKCAPKSSKLFKEGEIPLKNWIDEIRDPEQKERDLNNTSIFNYFNISLEELEIVIRDLVISKKALDFSKKYGKEMTLLYSEKIRYGNADEKMEYLTKSCKNGLFYNFSHLAEKSDTNYFLDELIRYKTLTEDVVEELELKNNKKALSSLIKNERCSTRSLEWANEYFDDDFIKKVYNSLSDDILLGNGMKREQVFKNIEKVDGLTKNYVNYLISKKKVDLQTLRFVKNDEKMIEKCVESIIRDYNKDDISLVKIYIFSYTKNNPDIFKKFIECLMDKEEFDFSDFWDFVCKDNIKDKDFLRKCVSYLISKDDIDDRILDYKPIQKDRENLTKCVNYLMKTNNFEPYHLIFVKNNSRLFLRCLKYLISNHKAEIEILENFKNEENLYNFCAYKLNYYPDNDTD